MGAATYVCFQQTENGNSKLPFVCCKWKWKTDVSFPWSANNKMVIKDFCFRKCAHLWQ
jgi:hypothetical protein